MQLATHLLDIPILCCLDQRAASMFKRLVRTRHTRHEHKQLDYEGCWLRLSFQLVEVEKHSQDYMAIMQPPARTPGDVCAAEESGPCSRPSRASVRAERDQSRLSDSAAIPRLARVPAPRSGLDLAGLPVTG